MNENHSDAASNAGDSSARAKVFDTAIGARLREQRTAHGFSQDRLAQKMGVSFQSVQRYERGSTIGAGRLVVAARALNIPLGLLLQDIVDPEREGLLAFERIAASATGAPNSVETTCLIHAYAGVKDPDTRQIFLNFLKRVAEDE